MMQTAPMIVPAQDVRLVMTTAGSREEAERIAHVLVEERVAACVNLVPGLTSIYRWKDAVETTDEILLLIKTTAENVEKVAAALGRIHSYELPEFLVLGPESGSQTYLEWIRETTG